MAPDTTVLIVDDDYEIREVMRRILKNQDDLELLVADGGPAALQLIDTRNVDVLMSDYHMPAMDGLTLMRVARERRPQTVRVLLSGGVEMSEVLEALNDGLISHFLAKPWHQNGEVIAAVRTALQLRSALLQTEQRVQELQVVTRELDRLGQLVPSAPRGRRHISVGQCDE